MGDSKSYDEGLNRHTSNYEYNNSLILSYLVIVYIWKCPDSHSCFFIKSANRIDWQYFWVDVIGFNDLPLFS
jgi:hypothetical protein